VNPFSNKATLVDALLTYAEKNRIRINLVLMDGGFFGKYVIQVLENHQLKYLFLVPKNQLVKKMIKGAHRKQEYVADYQLKQ
jgi:hypothetical protein